MPVNGSPETIMEFSRIMAILWKNSNGLEGPLSLWVGCLSDGRKWSCCGFVYGEQIQINLCIQLRMGILEQQSFPLTSLSPSFSQLILPWNQFGWSWAPRWVVKPHVLILNPSCCVLYQLREQLVDIDGLIVLSSDDIVGPKACGWLHISIISGRKLGAIKKKIEANQNLPKPILPKPFG